MTLMSLNSPTYALASATSSTAITLNDAHVNSRNLVVYNDTAYAMFLVSGESSAPTAAFPASPTVPVNGKVIPPGVTLNYQKPAKHKYMSAISAGLDSGKYLYVAIGDGE